MFLEEADLNEPRHTTHYRTPERGPPPHLRVCRPTMSVGGAERDAHARASEGLVHRDVAVGTLERTRS